jgi:sensor c-di-GMP phosphodiesterase-like protein
MTHDARTLALVSSTIDLAHSIGIRMVAEGVETTGTYTELTRLGCDQAQGYLMSKPIPATELDRWLTHRPAAQPSTDTPVADVSDSGEAYPCIRQPESYSATVS